MIEDVGMIVAETGMGWREALDMPQPIRDSVVDGIEDRIERKVELEEQRFEFLSDLFST